MEKKTRDKHYLVIWDDQSQFNFPGSHKADTVISQEGLKAINVFHFDAIFLLAELSWTGRLRTEFYGFEVAKQLRLEKRVLCPIVLCSFLSETQLNNFAELKILRRPGHYFLRLPDERPKEHYVGIDDLTLNDINIDLNDPEAELHTLMHNTLNKIPVLIRNIDDLEKVNQIIKDYLNSMFYNFKLKAIIQPEKLGEFESLKSNVFSDIDSILKSSGFKPEFLKEPLVKYKTLFYGLLPKPITDGNPIVTPKRWHVLYLDDQIKICEIVSEHFLRNEIICHTAQTAHDAIKTLLDDEKSSKLIAVVITDFRLYQNGNDEKDIWQEMQGYSFLKFVSENHGIANHYSYAILTGKEGTIKEQIKKRSEFPVLWFNKNDVLDGHNSSFNIFCQRIIESGDETMFKRHHIPNAKIWREGYEGRVVPGYWYYYKQHLNSVDYEMIEQQINRQVIENANNYIERRELIDMFDVQISLSIHKKNNKPEFLLSKFRHNVLLLRRIILVLMGFWDISKEKIGDYFISAKSGNEKQINKLFYYLGVPSNKNSFKNYKSRIIKYDLLCEEIIFLEKYAQSNNIDKSYLTKKNQEFIFISEYLKRIYNLQEFKDLGTLKSIVNRLNEPKHVTYSELKNCLNEIQKMISGRSKFGDLRTKLKRQIQPMYANDLTEVLDEGIRKLLINLND